MLWNGPMAFGHILDATKLRSHTARTYIVTAIVVQDWIRAVAGFGGVEGCFFDGFWEGINRV